jgi:predicted nucleic-acid-binding Zn-ribbon protein
MNNLYQDKYNEFINNIHQQMFTFELTKNCGYSAFITVYKNQTLMELYNNIVQHFENIQIKELYFISPEREKVIVPFSKQVVSNFVRANVMCNPCKLTSIYNEPNPIVYRLYIDDGENNESRHYSSIFL